MGIEEKAGTEADLRVRIAGVEWKNPVTVASGTFGSGAEFSERAWQMFRGRVIQRPGWRRLTGA